MHALAPNAPAQLADIPWWLFPVLVWVFIVIAQRVAQGGRLARKRLEYDADKQVQELKETPQGQQFAQALQTIRNQIQAARTGAQTVTTDIQAQAADGGLAAALRSPQVRQVLISDVAGTVRGIAERGMQVASPTMSALAADAANLASQMQLPLTAQPSGQHSPSRFASLATPQGLAYAIVAATVIGPPQGLRSEPMQPGGW
ncbi:MAG: hypothetical protein JO347_09855 [Candidatus Eremiobacteraeota bacterium]|nr:hypothetical protein [Candidatus Eremiobacteraeota bacterium]